MNNDGDELYLKPHESAVYLHDVGTNAISIVNQSFYKFIEFNLSHFISKDQTGWEVPYKEAVSSNKLRDNDTSN